MSMNSKAKGLSIAREDILNWSKHLDSERILNGYLPEDAVPVTPSELKNVVAERLQHKGFIIVDVSHDKLFSTLDPPHALLEFASTIGLSKPSVPSQYREGEKKQYYSADINLISPVANSKHSTFDSIQPQGIHTDETHAPINTIKTSLLYCKNPASKGGENRIYDIVGAVYDLVQEDLDAALSLFREDAFTKFSPNKPISTTGPAVAFDTRGRLVTRYAQIYCKWLDNQTVQKAAEFLKKRLSEEAPPFRHIALKLTAGQILVLANNQTAHDRTGFTLDNPPREVYRALFEDEPVKKP